MNAKKKSKSIDTGVLIPQDNISGLKSQKFHEELLQEVEEKKTIIINLKNVQVIDSIGIGVLIKASKRLHQKDGSLVLKDVSNDIIKMFKIMQIDKHIEIHSSAIVDP